jgi:hypothetical protein
MYAQWTIARLGNEPCVNWWLVDSCGYSLDNSLPWIWFIDRPASQIEGTSNN